MSSSGRKPLTLKGGSSTVRQSLSHSRTKAVVVEKKRRRVLTPKEAAEAKKSDAALAPAEAGQAEAPPPAAAKAPPAPAPAPRSEPKKKVLRTLTEEEKQKRALALNEAKKRAVIEQKEAEEAAKRKAEEDARRAAEEAEAAKRKAEEDAKRAAEEEVARKKAEEDAKAQAAEAAVAAAASAKAEAGAATRSPEARQAKSGPAKKTVSDAELERAKRARAAEDAKNATKPKGETRRRTGKLTISQALDDEGNERTRSLASVRRAREREKRRAQQAGQQQQFVVREVVIPEVITVQELANRMATRAVDIIKVLMKQGMMLKINDVIDADTAQLIAEEHGHTVKRVSEADVEEGIIGEEDTEESKVTRAPVVTIMGHVDHGKTSLLDALRATDVVSGEAGGITQHIGAYQVTIDGGDKISFLDTPGHAAFTQMRARGAKVTDIVVLVVAADDGVMPQTAEAISHAKAAEVPIIVAINKIDKPEADPNRVRQDLLQHELVVESLGGDIQDIEVSAIQKTGLDKLQEAILLQSEILELKANPERTAEGVAIEAKLDKGRGPVATVLIQRGTLKVGDVFVAGAEWGRVRALINDRSEQIDAAGPSLPVEILGFNGTPEAGDVFAVVESEARAREISDYRQRKRREMRVGGTGGRGSLEQMLAQLQATEKKEFPLVIKGDVQGSVEAIVGALDQLSTDEVAARPIHTAVGGITESDVILANASNCPIIAFNVRANTQARDMAQQDGVEIRYYSVIYDLVDDVKAAMSGLLDPTLREHFLGNAEIQEVFNISKVGKVAGCRVTEGVVKRGAKVRLIRDNVVIHEGTLSTLKRFKDEVKEVHGGQECGMAFENYQDLQKGDVIECFEVEVVERSL